MTTPSTPVLVAIEHDLDAVRTMQGIFGTRLGDQEGAIGAIGERVGVIEGKVDGIRESLAEMHRTMRALGRDLLHLGRNMDVIHRKMVEGFAGAELSDSTILPGDGSDPV